MGLLFTYVLTYGGAIASLYNPFLGLLIYVCFAIIKPETLWFWSVPPGNYSLIVAIAMLVGWAAHGFGNWRFGNALHIVTLFVAFWLWAVASALAAPNFLVAFPYVESTAKILIPFLVGMTIIDSLPKAKALAWTMTLAQAYVAWEMNLSYLGGYNRIRMEGFAGLDNNSIAIALVSAIGVSFFLAYATANWWHTTVAILATLVMLHAILLTFSRGGLLALVITAGVIFLLLPKRLTYCALFFLVVLIGIRLAGPEVVERFGTVFAESRDVSAQSRLDLWADCLDVMRQHPLLGLGPHHWPLIAADYGWPSGKEAHSLWLATGAELGFPGMVLLVLFYVLSFGKLWPLARGATPLADPWLGIAARMVVAGIVGFAVSAQFVTIELLELPYYIVLLGGTVLKLAPEMASDKRQPTVPSW